MSPISCANRSRKLRHFVQRRDSLHNGRDLGSQSVAVDIAGLAQTSGRMATPPPEMPCRPQADERRRDEILHQSIRRPENCVAERKKNPQHRQGQRLRMRRERKHRRCRASAPTHRQRRRGGAVAQHITEACLFDPRWLRIEAAAFGFSDHRSDHHRQHDSRHAQHEERAAPPHEAIRNQRD